MHVHVCVFVYVRKFCLRALVRASLSKAWRGTAGVCCVLCVYVCRVAGCGLRVAGLGFRV